MSLAWAWLLAAGLGAEPRGAMGAASPRPRPAEAAARGLWPAYPRAERIAKRLGGEKLRAWWCPDKPEAVLAYYQRVLVPGGWAVRPEALALAREGLALGQPAWLAFERPGMGKLELTVVPAQHPRTGHRGCVFYQETRLQP